MKSFTTHKLVFVSNKNPYLFLERSYDWIDRYIIIDESVIDVHGRRERTVVNSYIIQENINFNDWNLIDFNIINKCIRSYSEYIQHTRNQKLNQLI